MNSKAMSFKDLQNMWEKYKKRFAYAQNIDYADIVAVIEQLVEEF